MKPYDKEMETSGGTKKVSDAKLKNLLKANMISISPLEMIVKNKNNQIKKSLAINEVSVLRQSRQAASLSIKHGSKQIIKNFFI
mgnify:CR=1 FL=1